MFACTLLITAAMLFGAGLGDLADNGFAAVNPIPFCLGFLLAFYGVWELIGEERAED